MTDDGANPDPFTNNSTPATPALAVAGDKELMTGTGYTTAAENGSDTPPPGAGLTTVIRPLPTARTERSPAVSSMPSELELLTVVGRSWPFHRARLDARNPLPVTVIEVGPVPATRGAGETAVMVGTGFSAGAADDPPHAATRRMVAMGTGVRTRLLGITGTEGFISRASDAAAPADTVH